MNSSQIIILSIFLGYLILNVVVGVVFSAKRKSLSAEKDYFIGGRKMNGLVLAMTVTATYASVSSFVSGPGAAGHTYGYAQVWISAIQIPVTFFVLGVLGNKLALISRRTGAVTIVGFLKARYKSDVLVVVTSLLMVAFFIAQMIGQFSGGATLISSITGLNHIQALVIFGIVVIVYTAFGGFSAVVITDTIQGIIMCLGTFLFLFFVLKKGGGLSGIDEGLQRNLPGVYDNLFAKYKPGTLLSFWVLVGFGTLGLPQTAVRGMGFKNTKSLHSAMWIGALVCSFIIVGMHLAGVWAGSLTDKFNLPKGDAFIPDIVQKIMPVGIAGIFLTAPMAAVMSTADSLLILASATIIKDLCKTYVIKNDEKKLSFYNKNIKKISILFTFILGLSVMALTLNPPKIIFFLNLFALGGLECTFFWPLVGGLFWKRGTKEAAICSSISSIVVYILCHYFIKIQGIHGVVWGLLIGGIVYFIVGILTSKKGIDKDILEKCF